MNSTMAANLVREMDAFWRPASYADKDAYAAHVRALSADMVGAFREVAQVTPDQIRDLVVVLRQRAASSPDPMEALRRPDAWALRREWDRQHTAKVTGGSCRACAGQGRRHVCAVVWKNGSPAGAGLVVACECSAGASIEDESGMPLLNTVAEWTRNYGKKVSGFNVVAVVDVPAVYADVVAWAMRGLVEGEVPDDHLLTEVLRAVEAAKEST